MLTSLAAVPAASAITERRSLTSNVGIDDGAVPAQVVFDGAVADPLPPKPVSLYADEAIARAEHRTRFAVRACLLFVRHSLGIAKKYYTAYGAWRSAKHRHRTPISEIPAGVPVFTKGTRAAGHVVLSLGGGWVRSTDWPKDGRVGNVRLVTLLATWKQRYLGWTSDLNGVAVRGARPTEVVLDGAAGALFRLRTDI